MAPKPTCCMTRASPSPLAQTVDGKHPPFARYPSLRPFPCFLPCLGSLSPGAAARGFLLSRPEPLPHRVTPDDAPPDCVLSRIQNKARGTAVPILWLFVENHEDDFLSPALSGEKRDPSLLQPQAPGCSPAGASRQSRSGPENVHGGAKKETKARDYKDGVERFRHVTTKGRSLTPTLFSILYLYRKA